MSKIIIMIAEKPNAASKIAQALARGRPKKKKSKYDVDYYEFKKGKKKHIVVAAVGHLFNLKQKGKGWDYPVFDVVWMPSFKAVKRSAFSEKYFHTIEELTKKGSEYVICCDYDIEGSTIGYNILRFICKQNDGKRMKFSTLTKEDLIDAYENMIPHLDWGNIEAGLTRHYLDYYYGISVTRALTLSIKKGGKKLRFYLLSTGRVQAPMLHFLYKKEKEIRRFKPKPFWQVEAKITITKDLIITSLHHKDKFWKKPEANKIFKKCKKKKAIVKDITTRKYKQKPPMPFDLTTLQTEAYRFFGWAPNQTTNVAQSLYEMGAISYPRTSSQKLPVQIGYKKILKNISKLKTYSKLAKKLLQTKLKPNEGKRHDPAHPAVFPTAEVPDPKKLNSYQKRLYDLIVRRFLAVFGEPAIRESMKITFEINKEKFPATGRRTLEKGWMEYYGRYAKVDEIIFPEMKKGDSFNVKELNLLNKETSPPPRYSQGSIVKELEKHNIGTKTTRAQILQTLYNRGYIIGKSIEVTDLGMRVASILEKYVPDLVSEKLTRKFEKEMEKIEKNKKKRGTVVKQAQKVLLKITKELKINEKRIGKELEKAILETKQRQSILGPCPNCGKDLKILFSPRTKKRFVGCSGYPKCKTGFPIPLVGRIDSLDKVCEKCNTPMIQVWRAGKRPFRMC
ncbi:MAG: DNA topoisomerase I, partial [Methanosarcinales archaeon]